MLNIIQPGADVLCYDSISILHEKVTQFLDKKHEIDNLWFPDYELKPNKMSQVEINDISTCDVVLFGSFIRKILESGNWNFESIRLWVLCKSAKELLLNYFDLQDEQVSIIPRYDLFPIAEEQVNFPKLGEDWTMIYAGRLSATKNIKQLIWCNYYLQEFLNQDVELILFGSFDEQKHGYIPYNKEISYQEEIETLVESLDWRIKPKFRGKVSREEWHKIEVKKPVLCNFSTYMAEDFSASVAEAQSLGWPIIISNFGAHKDVEGSNVFKFPVHYILNSIREPFFEEGVGRNIAHLINDKIVQNKNIFTSSYDSEKRNKLEQPNAIKLIDLDLKRRNFIRDYGLEANLIIAGEYQEYSYTQNGQRFYKKYLESFLGEKLNIFSNTIIYPDLVKAKELSEQSQKIVNKLNQLIANSSGDNCFNLCPLGEIFKFVKNDEGQEYFFIDGSSEIENIINLIQKKFNIASTKLKVIKDLETLDVL